jgi:membrane protease YdiL (CAAX protease family)
MAAQAHLVHAAAMSARPDAASTPARTSAYKEVLVVYAAVWVATFLLSQTEGVPLIGEHRGELVGLLFLAVAMTLGARMGLERAGLTLGGLMLPDPQLADERPGMRDPLGVLDLLRGIRGALPAALRETGVALLVALVVFPPFIFGFYLYAEPMHPFGWSGVASTPAQWAEWGQLLLAQLLVVALPEEAFFRGYVQTRLANATHATDPRLRAPSVLLAQAVLFALVHLASAVHVTRLAVFFPALLFGLIRAKRGGIGAALVFHALCNLLSEVLTRGWLS